jgi:hypothetical protein
LNPLTKLGVDQLPMNMSAATPDDAARWLKRTMLTSIDHQQINTDER